MGKTRTKCNNSKQQVRNNMCFLRFKSLSISFKLLQLFLNTLIVIRGEWKKILTLPLYYEGSSNFYIFLQATKNSVANLLNLLAHWVIFIFQKCSNWVFNSNQNNISITLQLIFCLCNFHSIFLTRIFESR